MGLAGITILLRTADDLFLLRDRGYVLISFAGYNIEMSVPVLVVALVLLYVGVRLLLRLWRAPRQLVNRCIARCHNRIPELARHADL